MTMWIVPGGSWPVGDPIDPNVVRRVLAKFDEYYPAAVASLAEVEVPAPVQDVRGLAAGERSEE